MGLQHFTQDMSKIPLKYNINVLFYTKYTHPTLICRGTDARTHGRTENIYSIFKNSGISSCSVGSTYMTSGGKWQYSSRMFCKKEQPLQSYSAHKAALLWQLPYIAPTSCSWWMWLWRLLWSSCTPSNKHSSIELGDTTISNTGSLVCYADHAIHAGGTATQH